MTSHAQIHDLASSCSRNTRPRRLTGTRYIWSSAILLDMTGSRVTLPMEERYSDVADQAVTVVVRGEPTPALLFQPTRPGSFPGIVIGQEATGPNRFIRRIAATLAHLGYVALVPDYYHGGGPPDHENYDDIETIIEHMAVLDFRRGAYDLVEAVEHLKRLPNVDRDRLGLWGYCTGATITLLSACLRNDLAATILFYPSQPRFDTLAVNTPVHAIDMVWNLTSPVLLIVGEDDLVWPPELVADVRQRLTQWEIDHVIKIYPGAGHAFCSPSPTFHNADAEQAAWGDALRFLAAHLQ
jgi:carboxymethylenebutenolidase